MGTGMAVSLVVSIAMALLSTGLSANQLWLSSRNQNLKGEISKLISAVNSEIGKGRLSLNRILSILQTRNQNALMTYLQNNPVITRNLQAIQNDSELIASIQAEQSSLEADLANLQNELNSLGYSQSQKGATKEKEEYQRKKEQFNELQDRYNQLTDKVKRISTSTTNPVETNTSDIDARSQNINGGMK